MPKTHVPIQKKNQPYLLCLDTTDVTTPPTVDVYKIELHARGYALVKLAPFSPEELDVLKSPEMRELEDFILSRLEVTNAYDTPFGEVYDAFTASLPSDSTTPVPRNQFGRALRDLLPNYRSISKQGARYVNLAIKN